jgi:hypothetical protein
MSTLKVTNIQATGETASRAVSGVAAATVDCTPAGVVNTSFNVSSATDGSTGLTTINLTSSLASALETVIVGIHSDGTINRAIVANNTSASSILTEAFACTVGTVTDGGVDFSLSTHGDLA